MSIVSRAARRRVMAIAMKDAEEVSQQPGAILPSVAMAFAALIPAFLLVVGAPIMTGKSFEESGEFAHQAFHAARFVPELAALGGNAQIQAFLFHQFALLILLVPVVGAMAIAAYAVIGEKQSRALEPLLATPLATVELLAAKTLTPLVFATVLTWIALGLYIGGVMLVAEPGVWQAIVGMRLVVMFGILGPLVTLAGLQMAIIVSSRATDARSAQQVSSLIILPITAVFVAQMAGAYVVSRPALVLGAVGSVVLNAVLLWIGVRVFQRETILMRWR